jgi:hypothetical protein
MTKISKSNEPSTEIVATAVDLTELEGLQGQGVESATVADYATPYIVLAQGLTTALNPKDASYIKGLAQGNIYNTVTAEFYDTLDIVPCFFETAILQKEKLKIKAKFSPADPLLKKAKLENPLDSFEETKYWFCMHKTLRGNWEWCVLSFKGTGLKRSKILVSQLNAVKLEGKNGVFTPPIYANIVTLDVISESNDQGSFYNFKTSITGSTTSDADLFHKAKELYEMASKGSLEVKNEVVEDVQAPF